MSCLKSLSAPMLSFSLLYTTPYLLSSFQIIQSVHCSSPPPFESCSYSHRKQTAFLSSTAPSCPFHPGYSSFTSSFIRLSLPPSSWKTSTQRHAQHHDPHRDPNNNDHQHSVQYQKWYHGLIDHISMISKRKSKKDPDPHSVRNKKSGFESKKHTAPDAKKKFPLGIELQELCDLVIFFWFDSNNPSYWFQRRNSQVQMTQNLGQNIKGNKTKNNVLDMLAHSNVLDTFANDHNDIFDTFSENNVVESLAQANALNSISQGNILDTLANDNGRFHGQDYDYQEYHYRKLTYNYNGHISDKDYGNNKQDYTKQNQNKNGHIDSQESGDHDNHQYQIHTENDIENENTTPPSTTTTTKMQVTGKTSTNPATDNDIKRDETSMVYDAIERESKLVSSITERFKTYVDLALTDDKFCTKLHKLSPLASLALILMLNQFPRFIYRNTPMAFQGDEKAVCFALDGLSRMYDDKLKNEYDDFHVFFYILPFMHAENMTCQNRAVALHLKHNMDSKVADNHREIIQRFGRFPSRNVILNRASTQDEISFLESDDAKFANVLD